MIRCIAIVRLCKFHPLLVRGSTTHSLSRLYHSSHRKALNGVCIRHVASKPSGSKESISKDVRSHDSLLEQVLDREPPPPTTRVEKVKQVTADVWYGLLGLVGVVIVGGIGYFLFSELLSSKSPTYWKNNAVKLMKQNYDLMAILGEPIKSFGETTSRGRRRQVAHAEYEREGLQCMRVKFYVKGVAKQGVVHLEVCENEDNKQYDCRYLLVEVPDAGRVRSVVLVDNRGGAH